MRQSRVIPIAETIKENMAILFMSESVEENLAEMGLYVGLSGCRTGLL